MFFFTLISKLWNIFLWDFIFFNRRSATLLAVTHVRSLALITVLCARTSQTSFLEYSQEFNLIDHISFLGIGLELAEMKARTGEYHWKKDKGYRICAKLSSSEKWAGIPIPFSTPYSIFAILSSRSNNIQSGTAFDLKKIREVQYVLKLRAPVVRRLVNPIHRINFYPVDKC